MFSKTIADTIKKRISVRSYNGEAIAAAAIEKLSAFITVKNEKFKNRFRFVIVKKELSGNREKLGTYGWIGGADTFIVGVSKKGEKNIESYGCVFEEIILFATELDLGTCWLGVAFDHKGFSAKVNMVADEIIPAITPLGYKHEKRRLVDSLIRTLAKSNNRFEWDKLFFENDFATALSGENAGTYKLPLEMVRLAPSAGNKQPWRIIRNGDCFHFYLERDPGYTRSVHAYEIQRLDIGIAMSHFELSASEIGLKGEWVYTDPGVVSPGPEYIVSWNAAR